MHGRCIAGSIIVFVPHRSLYSTRERRDIPTDFIGNVVRRSACLCPSVGCGYKASLAETAEPIEPKLLVYSYGSWKAGNSVWNFDPDPSVHGNGSYIYTEWKTSNLGIKFELRQSGWIDWNWAETRMTPMKHHIKFWSRFLYGELGAKVPNCAAASVRPCGNSLKRWT